MANGSELEFGQHLLGHFRVGPYDLHLGSHLYHLDKVFSFHWDTLITAWAAMLVLFVLAFLATRKLNKIPSKCQAFAEMIMEFTEDIAVGQMGKEGYKHVGIVASLFLFILACNLIGELPLKLIHLRAGDLASPTNDINVTGTLAIIVSLYYLGAGFGKFGLGYFKHYLQPLWFMAPFNLLEDFTRPFSLAVRLFANILAGEIIIMVLISLLPLILPIPVMLFELFVAAIQAFIFAVLAASYIAASTSDSH